MSRDSLIKKRSFDFVVRIIHLYKYLNKEHGEFTLAKQVLRSGTAIGALVREAEFAESRNDFRHKLHISLKEANECVYWLELLFVTGYIYKQLFESVMEEAMSLLKMLASSVKTLRKPPG